MVFEDVETFLAAVDEGSIAAAAKALYIGQPTASQRIRHLEEELGVTLLSRKAGVRRLSLTSEGEHFLSIARQWVSLQRQAQELRDLSVRRELRVTATEMYSNLYLGEFFTSFVTQNPEVALTLQTEHASEIYQLIERQETDLGIVANLHQSTSVWTRPLFRERMVVLCERGSAFAASRNLSDLDPSREVYARWGHDFQLWHDAAFPGAKPLVTAGSAAMASRLVSIEGSWGITTEYLARQAVHDDRRRCLVALDAEALPSRTAYLLLYARGKPWLRETATHFIDELLAWLAMLPGVEVLFQR